ncbi:MAG: STM4012 family radical SAM protein [Thermosynechococcaceae cyanobacterium]
MQNFASQANASQLGPLIPSPLALMAIATPPIPAPPSLLTQSPYQSYVYSYPHKMTYRPFPDRPLSEIWAHEDCASLFLYIHIPLCEMRCGFCNLFTTVNHNEAFADQYIQTLQRQAHRVKAALNAPQFARLAIGGGTPTHLPIAALEAVLNIAETTMGANLKTIPFSVEVSPATATSEKLRLLRSRGTTRISIGVQSFIDSEILATQRRQTSTEVQAALTRIRAFDFPILNLDLIYGLPGQTVNTWLQSIRTALTFQPEEIYLYPLYVRPLTGLGCSKHEWDDQRLTCYRAGRDLLLAEGYTQVSMRMFRANQGGDNPGPVYCCQADGMVGLGCGARSYTKALHYSNDYAVDAKAVRSILDRYLTQPDAAFEVANYGYQLDLDDQKRRFILLSLLSEEGLNTQHYCDRFGTHCIEDVPELQQLILWNLAMQNTTQLYLTPSGIERSDAIGPWLFSEAVQQRINLYQWQ